MQKITFAEEVKPSSLSQQDPIDMSNRKMSSGSNDERFRRLSNHSIPEDAIVDDREHRQDWNKITADKDTWAYQERRRLQGWSNTDVATHKHISGRRGSVLSMWAPGKDANGRDVLSHNDDRDRDREDEGSLSAKSERPEPSTLMPGSPKESVRRSSNLSEPRRGSILSMWKGGKDANGNDIIGHDDEEWAR